MEETRRPRSLGALADTKKEADDVVVALAGNPNTGKSTVFNQLTGLRQHTGNWPGKTVASARGRYVHRGQEFTVIDLPGTYSLLANSVEEEIAREASRNPSMIKDYSGGLPVLLDITHLMKTHPQS